MPLEKLSAQLSAQQVEEQRYPSSINSGIKSGIENSIDSNGVQNTKKLPPVELWHPEYCGEIDLQIKANGDWF